MARKLKVFTWSDGFKAYTVAAPSRAKALQAWGFERDAFKDGSAHEISGGEDYAAAQDKPGEVVVRGLAVDIGEVTRLPKSKPKPAPAARKEPSRAAVERVSNLEAEVRTLAATQRRALAEVELRLRELEGERDRLIARQQRERDALDAKLDAARARLDG